MLPAELWVFTLRAARTRLPRGFVFLVIFDVDISEHFPVIKEKFTSHVAMQELIVRSSSQHEYKSLSHKLVYL